MYKIEFAPLQGYTDAIYRTMHNKVFGGINSYYSPFIRLEKGEVRQKDIKDILPENNENINLVPQIIVNSNEEFLKLTELVCNLGYKRIDINMGCPFPLQTKKGRGAALLQNTNHLEDIVESINSINDIDFSIKMRLGMDSAEDAKGALEIINKAKLHHLTIHPRIAKQQYKGEIDYQTFDYIYQNCLHPIIYNGDILSQEDIYNIINIYPKIAKFAGAGTIVPITGFANSVVAPAIDAKSEGIMIGRGLLAKPYLAMELNKTIRLSVSERLSMIMKLHDAIYDHYSSVMQGEHQLLLKMKTFWEYLDEEIGKKPYKAIKKSVNIKKYELAIRLIGSY